MKILLYIFLYSLIAAGHIFALLVGAHKYTDLEWPWMYIICGMLWPVAGLPAAGYIAAGRYLNREGEENHGE